MNAARRALSTNASSTGTTASWSAGDFRSTGRIAPPLFPTAWVTAAREAGGIDSISLSLAEVPETSPVVSAVPMMAMPRAEPTWREVLWMPEPSPD